MTEQFSIDPSWLPILIFCARIADVSIGTLRLICIVRGHRPLAVVLSFAEVLIWIFAITNVLTHLDQPANILAFAGGYAMGSAVGMWIESKLALGTQILTLISQGAAHAVAEQMRLADQSVTTIEGRNHDGPVAICHAILPRKQVSQAIRMARAVDPDVLATVEDVRTITMNHVPCLGPGKVRLPWRGPTLRRILRNLKLGGAVLVEGRNPALGTPSAGED